MSTSLSWIDDRESKAQLEAADHKRNCPSLVEKVTFKSKDNDTNNKTIHVAIFALLLMLINTNIVQISPITSYWHKNPSFFPIKYPCNISTKYPCSKPCTNMLLHQSHIMFYVSTNPPKKYMYQSYNINSCIIPTLFFIFLPIPKKYVSTFQYSCHKICLYPSHKYAFLSIPQICIDPTNMPLHINPTNMHVCINLTQICTIYIFSLVLWM